MARHTESVCRLCRREGMKLFLKGDRCFKEKCAPERRGYAPGQQRRRRTKIQGYGIQLREKQKVKRIYGVLSGSSGTTSTRRPAARESRGRTRCSSWSAGSTTSCTGWASRRRARWRASWSPTVTSRSTVASWTFASLVGAGAIVSLRESSRKNDAIKICPRHREGPRRPAVAGARRGPLPGTVKQLRGARTSPCRSRSSSSWELYSK